MNISAQNKAALFSLFQEFAANSPALNRAANEFCDFRSQGAKPGAVPALNPATGGGSPTGGGCGCGGGSSTPSTAPGSACTPGGIGSFNIQQVNVALAPCDIERIERQQKLLTFSGSLAGGAIAIGDTIAVEIPAVHVAHSLCMERFRVSITDDENVETAVTIGEVGLQPEIIVTSPQGSYIHAWDYYDPERPLYTDVTDARCACITLCVCVPSEAHARFVFVSPVAVNAGEKLNVTVWGRRKDWMSACGPCPPPDQCDRVELTPTELASTSITLYEVA